MSQVLRVRILTALLAAVVLTVAAASPMLSSTPAFGGAAQADECASSSC